MAAAPWSVDAVLGLAPDASSANAARGLAAGGRWEARGPRRHGALGPGPRQRLDAVPDGIDVAGPAYRCSCPSRKVPCKHALGLMLLHAGSPDAVPEADAPPWVREWLESRRERAERSAARGEARGAPDAEAQARRAAQRAGRVEQGLAELERWLSDLVRGGVAAAPSRSYAYWDAAAARLVDAQAPRLARRVRELAGAALARDEWTERLVGDLGRLALLSTPRATSTSCRPTSRAEVRSQLGFTVATEDVARGEPVRTTGTSSGRCWSRRSACAPAARGWSASTADAGALLMAFAAGTQPLEPALAPGTIHHAALAWYPGAPPTRALVVGDAVAAGAMDGCRPAAASRPRSRSTPTPWRRTPGTAARSCCSTACASCSATAAGTRSTRRARPLPAGARRPLAAGGLRRRWRGRAGRRVVRPGVWRR